MHLSNVHARYWATRRAPVWARAAIGPSPSIDACVNAHGGAQDSRYDLPVTLRMPAAAGRRRAQLQRIASEPSIGGRKSRDAANALKWLRRLEAADALAWWRGRAGLTGDALAAYDRAPVPWRQEPIHMACPGAGVATWWTDQPTHGHKLADCLTQNISCSEIPQCETHEILTPSDLRMFKAAHDEQQAELVMVTKPYSIKRYLKG